MNLHSLFMGFLIYGLYPAWLLAGCGDYLCHRRTHIEQTSGTNESLLHIAQFLVLLLVLIGMLTLKMTSLAFVTLTVLVVMHTVLAYVDVWYTEGRRYISPMEQQIHGLMNVIPLIAVSIIGLLNWDVIRSESWGFQLSQIDPRASLLILGSYGVLGGLPLTEEWVRTRMGNAGRQSQR